VLNVLQLCLSYQQQTCSCRLFCWRKAFCWSNLQRLPQQPFFFLLSDSVKDYIPANGGSYSNGYNNKEKESMPVSKAALGRSYDVGHGLPSTSSGLLGSILHEKRHEKTMLELYIVSYFRALKREEKG
jgi:hypothetical protein